MEVKTILKMRKKNDIRNFTVQSHNNVRFSQKCQPFQAIFLCPRLQYLHVLACALGMTMSMWQCLGVKDDSGHGGSSQSARRLHPGSMGSDKIPSAAIITEVLLHSSCSWQGRPVSVTEGHLTSSTDTEDQHRR